MFTEQHYKAIAKIIYENTADDSIYDMIIDLANYFEEDNSSFDRDKFIQACGMLS